MSVWKKPPAIVVVRNVEEAKIVSVVPDKLVEVRLVPLALAKLNRFATYRLVLLTLVAKILVEVTIVPEAVEKVRPPAVSAPAKVRLPPEVNLFAEEKNWISPVPVPP